MSILEMKKNLIKEEIKSRGYSMSEIARRLGKSPQNFIGGMKKLKSMHRLEKLELEIKEVMR